MGIYSDVIGSRSIGTGTARTQLSGDLSGNATAWTVPTGCKGILWVHPELELITPTATETAQASMSMDSSDLGLPPFEVLAVPLAGGLAATHAVNQNQDIATYPVMFDISDTAADSMAGAQVNFFGTPQVANTVAPQMGANIWWTDEEGLAKRLRGPGGPFQAKIGGAYEGGGASTSTGATAGSVTGKTAVVSSGTGLLRGVYGIVSVTTQVASKAFAGFFVYSSPELAYITRARMEPVNGALGATGQQVGRFTKVENIAVPFTPPTTILMNAFFDLISSTAGNFSQGILYQ